MFLLNLYFCLITRVFRITPNYEGEINLNYKSTCKMLKVLTIIVLSTFVFSFQIIERHAKPYLLSMPHSDMLGFDYFQGQGVSRSQVTLFTSLAKNASNLFGQKPYQHAQYIKQGMDNQYGSTYSNFFVMIQTEKTKSSYMIWITDQKVFCSLSGINPYQPNWSYLFVKINAPKQSPKYVFIEHGQTGMGITNTLDTYINKQIDKYEPPSAGGCQCNQDAIESIGTALNTGWHQAWSSICGSVGSTHSLVYTIDGLWISKERNGCEYTFYVHQS